jgi:hypothetical protein
MESHDLKQPSSDHLFGGYTTVTMLTATCQSKCVQPECFWCAVHDSFGGRRVLGFDIVWKIDQLFLFLVENRLGTHSTWKYVTRRTFLNILFNFGEPIFEISALEVSRNDKLFKKDVFFFVFSAFIFKTEIGRMTIFNRRKDLENLQLLSIRP